MKSYHRRVLAITLAFLVVSITGTAAQSVSPRDAFLQEIWRDAAKRGVSRSTFEQAFWGYAPSPEVQRQARSQPEMKQSIGRYVDMRVVPRVVPGREKAAAMAASLDRLEKRYGVQKEILLSIWGVETNFGGFLGGKNVIHSLATLTQRGYRAPYFRGELLTALDILQQGHTEPQNMVGSWAGAMGHTQFMPSSYVRFAQDFDGDGRKDIWGSELDALASAANYLKQNGWRRGETWGYEVTLPAGFDQRTVSAQRSEPIARWRELGVRRAGGQPFPRADDRATLYLPADMYGPAFLLLPNFRAIKRYNNANSYALAVGHLADRIAGGESFNVPWPDEETRNEWPTPRPRS